MNELDDRVERAVGSRPVGYQARPGGYTTADRFSVELADGRRIFVKSATEPLLADWLRREHEVYSSIQGRFMPRLEGWDDDGTRPLLAIEDLSGADWVPRWGTTRVGAVIEALAILVDWNWATLGDPQPDLAAWLPSLACEGGPEPREVLPCGAAYGALVSGVWAAVAGLPPPPTAPGVRDVQRRQLEVALAWCERELAA